MIEHADAYAIAAEWLEAWNTHDPDRVVEHFTDDVVVHSPLAAQLRPGSEGVLHGKETVLSYYRDGLAAAARLHFTLVEVCVGVNEIAIVYRNHRATLATETLVFDNGAVTQVHVSYGA